MLLAVVWGCIIHQLLLCRGLKKSLTSVLDMTLNNLIVRLQLCWGFGKCGEYPFIAIAFGSAPARVVALDWVQSMGQIEVKCVLILNWIVWNWTVFDIYLGVNKNIYLYKTELFEIEPLICNKNRFGIKKSHWLMYHQTKPKQSSLLLHSSLWLCEKMNGGIKSTSLLTTPNFLWVDRVLAFHHYQYILWWSKLTVAHWTRMIK